MRLDEKNAFRKIIGVEYAPALHRVSIENIRRYQSDTQK
jgi:hypothetical protein